MVFTLESTSKIIHYKHKLIIRVEDKFDFRWLKIALPSREYGVKFFGTQPFKIKRFLELHRYLNLRESNAMNWNYPNQYIPTPSWSPYHQNGQFDHQGIDPSFTGNDTKIS